MRDTNHTIQTYMFYQLKFFNPSISDSLLSTQVGIIVGAKTAAQVCTGMLWGRLADSEWGGRKTVLMIGLLCSGRFAKTHICPSNLGRHCMYWLRTFQDIRLGSCLASLWWRDEQ